MLLKMCQETPKKVKPQQEAVQHLLSPCYHRNWSKQEDEIRK